MLQMKTLQEREKELRTLLATPSGRKELQELEERYCAAAGRLKPPGKSVITYILVYEREHNLISS